MSLAESGNDLNTYQAEVDLICRQLNDHLNNELRPAAITPSQRASTNRYFEIVNDLRNEFETAFRNVKRQLERHELLGGSGPSSGNDTGMDSLLRERNHISNSLNIAGSVLGQAENIRSDLHYQGRSIRNTGGLMGQIAGNVPGLNNLIDNIRARRLQDDKVVAATIAGCIVFTLWYVFH